MPLTLILRAGSAPHFDRTTTRPASTFQIPGKPCNCSPLQVLYNGGNFREKASTLIAPRRCLLIRLRPRQSGADLAAACVADHSLAATGSGHHPHGSDPHLQG